MDEAVEKITRAVLRKAGIADLKGAALERVHDTICTHEVEDEKGFWARHGEVSLRLPSANKALLASSVGDNDFWQLITSQQSLLVIEAESRHAYWRLSCSIPVAPHDVQQGMMRAEFVFLMDEDGGLTDIDWETHIDGTVEQIRAATTWYALAG